MSEYNLTDREKQIAVLISKGYSNKMIGEQLFLSVYTIKNQVKNIMTKLNASNRAHIVSLYYNVFAQ